MKALVTGGAGFIGSHLVDHLGAAGWEIVILDDLSTGRASNLTGLDGPYGKQIRFVRGSITDSDLVNRLVQGVDVVFHLAAAVGVFTIQNETLQSIRTNLTGTEVVLDAAHRAGARMLLASTSEIYGKNTTIGLREDDDRIIGSPLKSRWSYAEAKALDETLVHQYVLHRGFRAVIVRLFNTAGPRQSGRYGMVLPRFVRQALNGDPLTVFGTGEQTRCFAHVHDIVPALVRLVDTPTAYGRAVNLGNPEQLSINDLAERVIARTGSSSTITYVPYEQAYGQGYEDMQRRVPNCDLAKELIGYAPSRRVDDIIDAVAEFERRQSTHPVSAAS